MKLNVLRWSRAIGHMGNVGSSVPSYSAGLTAIALNLATNESRMLSRICLTLLLVLVLLTAGVMVAMGATPILIYPNDFSYIIDGSWRVANGQIPHLDFFTPLGPVIFLVGGLGMQLAGPCVSSIAYANTLVFVVFSTWAWAIARTRLSPALSFLFALYVGFMVAATSVYAQGFKALGYSAMFNRYGVALTALVLLETLGCPRRQFRPSSYLAQGLSTGIALGVLFFLKLNFFGVASMGLMVGAILLPQGRSRWIGLCVGTSLIALLILGYLRFHIAPFYHDIAMAGRLRFVGFIRNAFGIVTWTYPSVFESVFLIAALWCIAPVADSYYRSWLSPKWAQGLVVAFLVFGQMVLSLTNSQFPLPTLFPAVALVILDMAWRAVQQPKAENASFQSQLSTACLATTLLALYFVVSILVPDMESLPYSLFIRTVGLNGVTETEKFTAAPLADMHVPSEPDYVRIINDGCALLRLHANPSDRIVTMDFSNPFSFALQTIPPKGDAIWWDRFTFSERVHLDPEQVFGQATLVMVPKKPRIPRVSSAMMDVYGPFIESHYVLVSESASWKLYRQRAASVVRHK